MMRVVVDASVAIKWYLDEPHALEARRLLDRTFTRVVPDLFFAEIGNTCWKLHRRSQLPPDILDDIRDAVMMVPLEVHPIRSLLSAAMAIAVRLGTTVYDSLYVTLSEQTHAPLVTADRRLLDAVSGGVSRAEMIWVADLAR
jgi:predicted nucleic acid-binding protein